MGTLVSWLLEAPLWELYLVMILSSILLILLVSPIIMRATQCGEENPATSPSESVRIVDVDLEETQNHAFAVRNVKEEATPKQLDRTSQDVNGTKTDCSARVTSAASVTNQS